MINLDLKDYMLNIDNLRNLTRFQTAPRNIKETVAEHSFYVAAIVIKLYDYFEFDLQKALVTALLHDYSEVYITDIPHTIKKANPELTNILEGIEQKVNSKDLSDEIAKDIIAFNACSDVEGSIVALADIISVLMYSRIEIKLGNEEYMKQVYYNTFKRMNDILSKMNSYTKPGVSLMKLVDLINDFTRSKIKDN